MADDTNIKDPGAAQGNPEQPLVLRPRSGSHIDDFLNERELLSTVLTACGSPLNILFPQAPAANLSSFQDVLKKNKLRGKIFFAHKANQSQSLLRELAMSEVNCDVASANELRHALGAGFTGERLGATGPKNPEFIGLALLHGVALSVDSMAELADILKIQSEIKSAANNSAHRKARILVRVCGFGMSDSQTKESRFGTTLAAVPTVLAMLAENCALVDFLGFSFHLDSTSLEEKAAAVGACLTLCEQAVDLGLEPRVINIGGGFRVNYLADAEDWTRFANAVKEAALGKRAPLTWQNNHFGLSVQGGALRGNLNNYGFYETRPGAAFLSDLLASELPEHDNRRIADLLRDNMIELWLEPGRALLDLAGITVARVNSVKLSSHGNKLVALNMKRQDLAFLDQEIFVDPLHFTSNGAAKSQASASGPESTSGPGSTSVAAPERCEVYLTGNLCLESDLIFRRKLALAAEPQPGDILVFINTAAYMMDFSATNSIMQDKARRIAVVDTPAGNSAATKDSAAPSSEGGNSSKKFVWMLDEEYTPFWRFNLGR